MKRMYIVCVLLVLVLATGSCAKINPESKVEGLWKTAIGDEKVEFFKDHTAMYYPSLEKRNRNGLPQQIEFNWTLVDDNRIKFSSTWYGSAMGQIQGKILFFNGSEFTK